MPQTDDNSSRVKDKARHAIDEVSAKTSQAAGRVREEGQKWSLTLLRIAVGIIMTVHGGMKLADPQATASSFASMGIPLAETATYLAIAGELLGGLGLLFGLLTRVAALGPLAAMVVAIGFAHLGNGLLAKNGGWEYPLTLLLVSLLFAFTGAGPHSIDALLAQRKKRQASDQSEDRSVSHLGSAHRDHGRERRPKAARLGPARHDG